MAIPRAVREQAERAAALQGQLTGNTAGEPATPAQQQTEPPQPTPQPQASDPAPIVIEAPEPAPAPTEPAPRDDGGWEQKYKVLAGKYSAEVPRFADEIRELKRTNTSYADEIRALKEQIEQLQAKPPAPAVFEGGLTPEQVVERFGEDFANAVGAVASQIADRRVEAVRAELTPKVQQASEIGIRNARQEFIRELEAKVPDWRAIDSSDGFTAFLDEVDPMSGRSRREFFAEADARNDAARIALFFTTFKGASTPAGSTTARRAPIDQQLAPDTTRIAEAPPSKKLWSRAEIQRFYADARRGAYKPADYQRIESDIFAAQRENRIAA